MEAGICEGRKVRRSSERRSWLIASVALAVVAQLPTFLLLHLWLDLGYGLATAVTVAATIAWLALGILAEARFRFSLRTFLIAVTLIGVAFGTLGLRLLTSQAQWRAVTRLRASGAMVRYDYHYDAQGRPLRYQTTPGDHWLYELCGQDFFHDVVLVNLQRGSYTETDFEQLANLRACGRLTLMNNVEVTATAFRNLGQVPGLTSLTVESDAIDDSHLAELVNAKNLINLNLSYCPKVTDVGLVHIGQMEQLERLTVGSAQITEAGVAKLHRLKNLKSLCLAAEIGDSAMKHVTSLARLERLNLSASEVGDEGIAQLSGLQELQSVWLIHTNVSDQGVRHLSTLPRIRELNLAGTRITDASLNYLEKCADLELLDLGHTGVSDERLAAFRRALPKCKVVPPQR